MSNLRSWKAIKNPVFEQDSNTLIVVYQEWYTEFFSKKEEKYDTLRKVIDDINIEKRKLEVLFFWAWAKASHVFELDIEDMHRLLDNQ